MIVGNQHFPSTSSYNQLYKNPYVAYMLYKDTVVQDNQQFVTYDSWRYRYCHIWFDFRGEHGLFDVAPMVSSSSGIDWVNRDIWLVIELANAPAFPVDSDLKAIVTHYVASTIVFDKSLIPKRIY